MLFIDRLDFASYGLVRYRDPYVGVTVRSILRRGIPNSYRKTSATAKAATYVSLSVYCLGNGRQGMSRSLKVLSSPSYGAITVIASDAKLIARPAGNATQKVPVEVAKITVRLQNFKFMETTGRVRCSALCNIVLLVLLRQNGADAAFLSPRILSTISPVRDGYGGANCDRARRHPVCMN